MKTSEADPLMVMPPCPVPNNNPKRPVLAAVNETSPPHEYTPAVNISPVMRPDLRLRFSVVREAASVYAVCMSRTAVDSMAGVGAA